MSALDDIKARAKAKPCTHHQHHDCARADRTKLVAALEAVEERLKYWDSAFNGEGIDDVAVKAVVYFLRTDMERALK